MAKGAMVGLESEGAYGPVSFVRLYPQTVASGGTGVLRLTQHLNDTRRPFSL